MLEQLHVLPNVTYLAKVRNTDEIIEHGEHKPEMKATLPASTKAEEV